jgi:hypothetical protein
MPDSLFNSNKAQRFLDGRIFFKKRLGGAGPASFGRLMTWFDAAKDVLIDGAASFVSASNSNLSSSSTQLQSVGSFTWVGWFYIFGAPTGFKTLFGKYNSTGNQREWVIRYDADTGLLNLITSNDGIGLTVNGEGVELEMFFNTWTFISFSYDSVPHLGTVRINNLTQLELDISVPFAGTAAFRIGIMDTASFPLDGNVDSVARWNRVLSSAELDYLYNAGAGKVYADLNVSIKNSLVSWWDLDETVGTRFDSHGTNHLTDNSVGGAIGLVSARATDGDPVKRWGDQGGINHQTQATYASRPLYKTSGIGARPAILFDGADDFLKCSGFTLVQPYSIYMVARQVSWASGLYLSDGDSNASGAIVQTGVSPIIGIAAPTPTVTGNQLVLSSGGIITAIFNGASGTLQIDNMTTISGNPGANALNGLTLGSRADGTKNSNVYIGEVLVYSGFHDGTVRALVKTYLSNKYSLNL